MKINEYNQIMGMVTGGKEWSRLSLKITSGLLVYDRDNNQIIKNIQIKMKFTINSNFLFR